MKIRNRLEVLIKEMFNGRIILVEAVAEFEKHYIPKAFERNGSQLTKTDVALDIHRNTSSKRLTQYAKARRSSRSVRVRRSRRSRTASGKFDPIYRKFAAAITTKIQAFSILRERRFHIVRRVSCKPV